MEFLVRYSLKLYLIEMNIFSSFERRHEAWIGVQEQLRNLIELQENTDSVTISLPSTVSPSACRRRHHSSSAGPPRHLHVLGLHSDMTHFQIHFLGDQLKLEFLLPVMSD